MEATATGIGPGPREVSAFDPTSAVLSGPGTITAISGLTFSISDERGDYGAGPHGLIMNDTRHLSRLDLRIDDAPVSHLGAALLAPHIARFRGYALPSDHHLDPPLEVERRRRIRPDGMDEEIALHWWAAEPGRVVVSVCVDCDFADIFEIRRLASTGAPTLPVGLCAEPSCLEFATEGHDRVTSVRLAPEAESVEGRTATWTVDLERGAPWTLSVDVAAKGASPAAAAIGHPPPRSGSVARVTSDPDDFSQACRAALADLRALSLPDQIEPSRRLVAAGIPWFVALFGRDSLISSYQTRTFAPGQMLDTLRALAARQGRVRDPANEEEPGKILHEVRLTDRPWLGDGTSAGARPYYGSVDATALFVILLGIAWRWGLPREAVEELLPAALAAHAWMRDYGDRDGDGLIEYAPPGGRTLSNQGWKDSENAVQHPDGTLAEGPIALVEVQGYAYRARRELAAILAWTGRDALAAEVEGEADALRALIRERYWQPGGGGRDGHYALALDGRKRPVAPLASNMGHLLWCRVPSNEEAEQVGRHLAGRDLASGWGVRTLSASSGGFNPISYHVGSVWPHDTAICCDGLRHYGLDEQALDLAADLLEALLAMGGRLPELFGGHQREPGDFPIPYPAACRPQAWAAGVPLAFVPLFLGLEAAVPDGRILLSPALPRGLDRLEVRGIPFPGGRLSVEVDRTGLRVIESPPGLSVELRPRSTARAV